MLEGFMSNATILVTIGYIPSHLVPGVSAIIDHNYRNLTKGLPFKALILLIVRPQRIW